MFTSLGPVKQARMHATVGQWGIYNAHCFYSRAEEVARIDRPDTLAHDDFSEATIICASTLLYRFGLPYNYSRLEVVSLPPSCLCRAAPLWDLHASATHVDCIFVWQCHSWRCGGDGRRLQAHEIIKIILKIVILSNRPT